MTRSDNNEQATSIEDVEGGISVSAVSVQTSTATEGSAKINPASLSVNINVAGVTCFDYSPGILARRGAYLLANRGPLSEDTSEAE